MSCQCTVGARCTAAAQESSVSLVGVVVGMAGRVMEGPV